MSDDHKEENPDLYEFYTHELTEEEGRDFLEKIGVDTPKTQREILDSMRTPSSGEFNAQSSKTDPDEIPNRIPLGRKVPYGFSNEEFNKLSKDAQERYLKCMAARNKTAQNTADTPEGDGGETLSLSEIDEMLDEMAKKRYGSHSHEIRSIFSKSFNGRTEDQQAPSEPEQPKNACGDLVNRDTGLPEINEKAYKGFMRGL